MTQINEHETTAQTPIGLNHVVLNVRDIAKSHCFWTDLLGFRQVAAQDGRHAMRFYSGERDGKLRHHDIALVQAPPDLSLNPPALHHVAVEYPTREAWEKQIAFLKARGVALYRRVERGVTHSIHLDDPNGYPIELVFELPRALWESDMAAALNHAVERPIT
jgi:catechol 2,3-dioxygenase